MFEASFPMNDYTQRVRDYYDQMSDIIVASVGTTYQAGLVTEARARSYSQSNVYLAKRAGVKPGDAILDAGCGVCGPAIDIARAFARTTVRAVTLSSRQAKTAEGLIVEAGLSDRIEVSVGDYHDLLLPDGAFDVVLFLESLGYSHDLPRVLAGALRVLKPGGRLYVKDAFRKHGALSALEEADLREFDAVYRNTTRTLEEVTMTCLRGGFERVETRGMMQASTKHFDAAMIRREGGQTELTEFGRHHFRPFRALPVFFGEIRARRPARSGAAVSASGR